MDERLMKLVDSCVESHTTTNSTRDAKRVFKAMIHQAYTLGYSNGHKTIRSNDQKEAAGTKDDHTIDGNDGNQLQQGTKSEEKEETKVESKGSLQAGNKSGKATSQKEKVKSKEEEEKVASQEALANF